MKRSPSVGQSDMKCKKTTSASITEVVRESQDPEAGATLLRDASPEAYHIGCQYPKSGATFLQLQHYYG